MFHNWLGVNREIEKKKKNFTLYWLACVFDFKCNEAQCKSPIQIEQMVQYHPVVGTKNCNPRIGVRFVDASG